MNDFTQEDFQYVLDLPYSLRIPELNALIVHAGLVPGISLDKQKYLDLTHIRNITNNKNLFDFSFTGIEKCVFGVPWVSLWNGPEHVYFGHDARRGIQNLPHATGLDTGCVYGKKLTGVIIDPSKGWEFIDVPAKQVYNEGNVK